MSLLRAHWPVRCQDVNKVEDVGEDQYSGADHHQGDHVTATAEVRLGIYQHDKTLR